MACGFLKAVLKAMTALLVAKVRQVKLVLKAQLDKMVMMVFLSFLLKRPTLMV